MRCHAGDNDGPESVMLVIHLSMRLQSSTKILRRSEKTKFQLSTEFENFDVTEKKIRRKKFAL